MTQRSDLISARDAAHMLGITSRHVARLVARHQLEAAVQAPGPRGAYLFERSEVERLAAQRRGVSA